MAAGYQFIVQDVFRFRGGRTVFVGTADGAPGFIRRGMFDVFSDGEFLGTVPIEGEMIANAPPPRDGAGRLRSLSSTEEHCLDRQFVEGRTLVLRPANHSKSRERVMHRHLLGLDSPPSSYVADPVTQGPVLPEGWDGDAWVDIRERGYFLRAWSKESGRVAYGRGSTYDEARRDLLNDVARGVRKVATQEIGVG